MGDPKRRGNLKGWVALKDGEPKRTLKGWETLKDGEPKRSLKGWGEWGGPHGEGGKEPKGSLKGA